MRRHRITRTNSVSQLLSLCNYVQRIENSDSMVNVPHVESTSLVWHAPLQHVKIQGRTLLGYVLVTLELPEPNSLRFPTLDN